MKPEYTSGVVNPKFLPGIVLNRLKTIHIQVRKMQGLMVGKLSLLPGEQELSVHGPIAMNVWH